MAALLACHGCQTPHGRAIRPPTPRAGAWEWPWACQAWPSAAWLEAKRQPPSPHPGPRVGLTPRSGPVGTRVSVQGSGFRPRVRGVVVFGRRRVGSFSATRKRRVLPQVQGPGRQQRPDPSRRNRSVSRQASLGPIDSGAPRPRFRVVAGSLKRASERSPGGGGAPGSRWVPAKALTWYWQLPGTVNNHEPVAAYDIDGFDNSAAEVATLHAAGQARDLLHRRGHGRELAPGLRIFPASVLGSSNGWPGERWLDIRQLGVLEPIMTARFQMCREKGFDAVEPDNIDGYENSTGFPLTAAEQLSYNEWIAGEVHSLGMAVFRRTTANRRASSSRTSTGPWTSSATSTTNAALPAVSGGGQARPERRVQPRHRARSVPPTTRPGSWERATASNSTARASNPAGRAGSLRAYWPAGDLAGSSTTHASRVHAHERKMRHADHWIRGLPAQTLNRHGTALVASWRLAHPDESQLSAEHRCGARERQHE